MARTRTAVAADLDTVVRLSAGLFREDSGRRDETVNQDWPAREGEAYFGAMFEREHSVVLVAEDDGAVVGYVAGHLTTVSTMSLVPLATMESIYVEPSARGRGVGGILAAALIHWATDRGAAQMRVTAYAANQGAVRLYQRLGFTPHELTLSRPLVR